MGNTIYFCFGKTTAGVMGDKDLDGTVRGEAAVGFSVYSRRFGIGLYELTRVADGLPRQGMK